ncbi:MAG TPA: DUF3298 and DUF4163 domain-containing protein [Clostridiales bacterium]|nr:DUF3298 and DUF4163 domain-containing protein [Clostridiales bacterium]
MDNKVLVRERVFQEDKLYDGVVVLRYKIKYPYFVSDNNQKFFDKLNDYYCMYTLDYINHDIAKMYKMAVDNYNENKKKGYPFNAYEVVSEYNVSYNKNCAISLYFDRYEYMGGAHGNTLRYSDTWDIQKKSNILLSDLVKAIADYRNFIIESIIKTISNEIEHGNNFFFEKYEGLVRNSFKESNYYLSDVGIVVYFLQYDIAPYSSGIQTFTIPYSIDGVEEPTCY